MKALLRIAFLGTNYCGYQVQPNGLTIQQRLNEAAKALFGFDCDIVGCSRTDSGVHANEFVIAVSRKGSDELTTSVPVEKLPVALSNLLPEDISVLSAQMVPGDFHPRYDVKYKEYLYQIWNAPVRNPFLNDRAWHCVRPMDDEAMANMQKAAALWIGTHDFSSYMAANSSVTDTVRTITEVEVSRQGDMVVFRVCADGFLYHMVRILVGTLIEVAYGRLHPDDIPLITDARNRHLAGATAPACGLYLNRVVY